MSDGMQTQLSKMLIRYGSIVLIALFVLQPCFAEILMDDPLYQVNTFANLEKGAYNKVITVDEMAEKGDLGVGAFEDLDGELIQMNGTIYQITSDGVVHTPPGDTGISFMNTVRFNPVRSIPIPGPTSLASLKEILNTTFPSDNQIYAIRVDGIFSEMKIRSVPAQDEPYPPLSTVLANQSIFNLTNSTGTITGFWFPSWMQGTNYAGFHLHYLSSDHTAGGHILGCILENGTAAIDPINSFHVDLITANQE